MPFANLWKVNKLTISNMRSDDNSDSDDKDTVISIEVLKYQDNKQRPQ